MFRALSLMVALGGCRACDEAKPKGDAASQCLAARAAQSGEATHYAADGTGSCSFDKPSANGDAKVSDKPDERRARSSANGDAKVSDKPDERRARSSANGDAKVSEATKMVAAINGTDYANAAWCGACVEVTGPSGSVVVRVVDKCPGCAKGDLDLSREAFEHIAPLSAGRVPISWREVACEVTGPISYQFKDGSSQHWTGIQIRNHRYPIATLEARDTSGAYAAITRLDYNYFVDTDGLGPGPYTLRVTDTRGQTIEDVNIAVGDNVARTGAAQFPTCTN